MVQLLAGLEILAAQGVPGTAVSARLAVPIGMLVFLGTVYMLLRANLGTRRAYLVLATSFFGFMIIMSLFWTFGAPGTPQAVGPTHLPGQPSDAYQPTWTPFAIDSRVAERPEYDFVQDYPNGFEEPPEGASVGAGVEAIASFFAGDGRQPVTGFDENWEPGQTLYAEAPNGYPVVAVTFAPPADEEEGEAADDGGQAADDETVTLFAFFDAGAPLFPGIVFIIVAVIGFLLHVALLNRDEAREQRELAELAAEEEEKVPAGV